MAIHAVQKRVTVIPMFHCIFEMLETYYQLDRVSENIKFYLFRWNPLKSGVKPGTFERARKRCNTCPFIRNADKIT